MSGQLTERAQRSHCGLRLDVFVSRVVSDNQLSRGEARQLCRQGKVRVGERLQPAGYLIQIDDLVSVTLPTPVQDVPPLCIVYEDEHLLIVEKKRGMHSVRRFGKSEPTLADSLAAYCPKLSQVSIAPEECGLVQRLDFWTSGLLIAAKNQQSYEALRAQITRGDIRKCYYALVESGFPSKTQVVTAAVDADKRKTVRVVVDAALSGSSRNAAPAYSRFRKVGMASRGDLVLVRGRSMRRHQVRAHAGLLGHPLVGDGQYGAAEADGFYLHARSICFTHPSTGERMRIRSQATF